MKTRFVHLLLVGMVVAAVNGCFGPKPVIIRYTLQAPFSPDQPHHLLVTLQNRGSGEGQAEVIARLRSQATGQTVAEASDEVDLKAHETVTMTIPLRPANPGPYHVSVEVQAPPE